MNEDTMFRSARDANWYVQLPTASAVRAQARRRRRRRIGVAAAATACVVAAAAFMPVISGNSGEVADGAIESPRVGSVVLDHIPRGWSLTRKPGSDLAADVCIGPESNTCAVRVLATHEPALNSGIPWFSVLTEPCISNSSTQVLTDPTRLPAGPAQKQTLECAGRGVTIHNVAWVLDAGVAVIPKSSDEVEHGRDVVEGLRFAAGTPSLEPVPSEEPSAEGQSSP